MASAFDENRYDTGLASRRNPRHRAIESEGTHVRFNGFGQIDRNPAFSSQHAHQPAAYENMLGIEGDRAGQVAPWLEPSGARRLLIENVQRVVGQQRKHKRGVYPRLMRDDINDRRFGATGDADRPVVNTVCELERYVEKRLPQRQAKTVHLQQRDRQIGGGDAAEYYASQDHAFASQPVIVRSAASSAPAKGRRSATHVNALT